MFKLRNKYKFIKVAVIIMSALIFLTACNPKDSSLSGTKGNQTETYRDAQKNAQQNCWQKSVLNILYDVMSNTAIVTLNKFTEGALAISMIGFAIWLIIKLLAYVSSVTENSGAELWNEIFKKLFLCFVCGTIANSPALMLWVLNTLIFPIYVGLIEMGSAVVSLSTPDLPNSCTNLGGTVTAVGTSLPTYPREMMGCLICMVNQQMSIGLHLGFKLVGEPGVGFLGWISGIILALTFTIVRLGFVFYLIDTLFRMCIVIIILPLFVLSYAFEYTKSYPKVAFSNLISSAAYMLMISVVLSISVMAVVNYINTVLPELKDVPKGSENIIAEKYKAANEPVLIILCFSFLVTATLNISKELANKIILPSGAVSNTMQKSVKGAMMKIAKVAAFLFAGPVAKKLVSKVGDKVKKSDRYQNMKEKANKVPGVNTARNLREGAQNVNKFMKKIAGRDQQKSGKK